MRGREFATNRGRNSLHLIGDLSIDLGDEFMACRKSGPPRRLETSESGPISFVREALV